MTSTSFPPTSVSLDAAITKHLNRSAKAAAKLSTDERLLWQLRTISSKVLDCFSSGGKLLICGNGGSAADAQHIAAEFVGRYKLNRSGLPAIALTTDSSILTAVGNDFDFSLIFARQVRALGKPNDLLWAITTSGHSPNVLHAVQVANALRMKTIVFTSMDASDRLTGITDVCFRPDSSDTAVIQQLHMIGAHAVCDAVERQLAQ
jgi:D-sedoheptulose 7-phosphate isomerase